MSLALKYLSAYPSCLNLFYDGLADIVLNSETDLEFASNSFELIGSSFQTDFVIESSTWKEVVNDANIPFKCCSQSNICEAASDFVVKILPTCLEMIDSVPSTKTHVPLVKSKINVLASKWNFVQACERKLENSLESVDALLSCGFILNDDSVEIESLPMEQLKIIILSLFCTIDWIKELLNSFSTQTQELEFQRFCLKRCEMIPALIQKLDKCLAIVPPETLDDVFASENIHRILKSISSTKHLLGNFSENSTMASARDEDVKGKGKEKMKTCSFDDFKYWTREIRVSVFVLDLFLIFLASCILFDEIH
jgi:hypothetical protein